MTSGCGTGWHPEPCTRAAFLFELIEIEFFVNLPEGSSRLAPSTGASSHPP